MSLSGPGRGGSSSGLFLTVILKSCRRVNTHCSDVHDDSLCPSGTFLTSMLVPLFNLLHNCSVTAPQSADHMYHTASALPSHLLPFSQISPCNENVI